MTTLVCGAQCISFLFSLILSLFLKYVVYSVLVPIAGLLSHPPTCFDCTMLLQFKILYYKSIIAMNLSTWNKKLIIIIIIIITILQFLWKISKCIYCFVFVNEMMTFYLGTSMLNKLWNFYEKYI